MNSDIFPTRRQLVDIYERECAFTARYELKYIIEAGLLSVSVKTL